MAKAHRGFGIRELPNRGRGECPICKRTGIKVVYEREINGKKVMVCKPCRVALSRGKFEEKVALI